MREVEEPVPSVAEGTPAMLVGRCFWELSDRKLQRKIKKSQPPTGAYPDFLPGSTGQSRVYAFLFKERPMRSVNATNLHRKSGVAQWRDLLFLFRFKRRLFSPVPFTGRVFLS